MVPGILLCQKVCRLTVRQFLSPLFQLDVHAVPLLVIHYRWKCDVFTEPFIAIGWDEHQHWMAFYDPRLVMHTQNKQMKVQYTINNEGKNMHECARTRTHTHTCTHTHTH